MYVKWRFLKSDFLLYYNKYVGIYYGSSVCCKYFEI